MEPMDCDDFFEANVEGAFAASPELEARCDEHAKGCEDCRRTRDGIVAYQAALKERKEDLVASGLVREDVLKAAEEELRKRARRHRSQQIKKAATGLGGLALALLLFWGGSLTNEPTGPVGPQWGGGTLGTPGPLKGGNKALRAGMYLAELGFVEDSRKYLELAAIDSNARPWERAQARELLGK
jgi:hypothetical protein